MADLKEIVEIPLSTAASYSEKQGVTSAREDRQVQFYKEPHRKVGEEYDGSALKKYDKSLNTTLIFASLFSVVTTAFIVKIDSKLRPDPGNQTAALFRAVAYNIDKTTFESVPTLPRWTGPPPSMVHVQLILYASLVASLFPAFLAMLGKQWLNRHNSLDMRRSAIERNQRRQREMDGIIARHFGRVTETLPSMLQVALLLLGCALSRYLWEIDAEIASVVIGATSLGVLVYLFFHHYCRDHF